MDNDLKPVQDYIGTIEKELVAGNATEHTHRPALKALIEDLGFGSLTAWLARPPHPSPSHFSA